MDYSLPGSSVHGILQARILEWVSMVSSGDLPNPGIEPESLYVSCIAGRFFTTSTTWEVHVCVYVYIHIYRASPPPVVELMLDLKEASVCCD